MVCAICCIHMCSSLVNMVKSIAVIFVVLAISQTQALPTYGNRVEIEFSEDSNIAPTQVAPPQFAPPQNGPPQNGPPQNGPPQIISQIQALPTYGNAVEIEFSEDSKIAPPQVTNRQQKIEFLQDNEAQNLEEALFTYTQLLMNEKSGIQPFQDDNLVNEQSTALCSERACDCSIVKIADFEGTRRDTGEKCLFAAVPHCEGVCTGIHRYYTANYVLLFIHAALHVGILL